MVRLPWGKFIITKGKDKVTQGKYNLGRYKYSSKVTLGTVAQDKFNQDIFTLGKDKVTKGKLNLGRCIYPGLNYPRYNNPEYR